MRSTLAAVAFGMALCLAPIAQGTLYTFVPGGANDWWMTTSNWNPNGTPNSVNDTVVFDASANSSYSTNVHSQFYTIAEMRFATTSAWRIYNPRQDPWLDAPSGNALITQNGSGAVTFDTDLRFVDDTVFGGTGTGDITVNGSGGATNLVGVWGAGGLTLQGNYTLALNVAASYEGPTTVNAGALLFNGESATQNPYAPVEMAPFTVNSGGTLGGTGTLRADVTVNSGGAFAPGESAGTLTIEGHDLTLASGSTTAMELGGATPGSGHDQAIVGGQLSLGGTLDVALTGGHVPTRGDRYAIFQYGSLNAGAGRFDAVNLPTHSGYEFAIDYGTGANSAVSVSTAAVFYYTGANAGPDYWEYAANWDPQQEPGSVASLGDIVVFDRARSPVRNVVNIWNNDRYVREVRFKTDGSWRLHHNHYDLHLDNPDTGGTARFTQDDSGPVTIDCDLVLDDDTIFGGGGGGRVTLNGRNVPVDATYGLRATIRGTGGLIKNGSYDLVINNYASYQGPTTINDGALIFNAESAEPNPSWVYGDPATYYLPVTMAPVTVNAGGTLGGTGILRAPVTVNSGGTFAPGESAGVFTLDSLTLAAGSTTQMELGGATPGNGTGHHDQAVVTGQLSLGGTLDVSLTDGYVPTAGTRLGIIQYGALDGGAAAFDAVNLPSLPGQPAHHEMSIHYGTGRNSMVTLSVDPTYYYIGPTDNNWWMTGTNWTGGAQPGTNAATGDVVVFDENYSTGNSTNTHSTHHYVKEVRFNTSTSWRMHNSVWDIYLSDPVAGGYGLVTQNGSGPVTFDCDLRLDDDTIFGGTGTGTVTVNGSETAQHATHGPRSGVYGDGALIKTGSYTLALNNVASYQGGTVINGGTLLFNAESAMVNPDWSQTGADPWLPVTQGPVTVNAGGTLGGTGILRAPVTVNDGGTFAPGGSAGVFTLDSLTLAAGSTTQMELGGTTPGNDTGHHDQAVVTGQASLGGTLDVSLVGAYVPTKGDSFDIMQYGSLDPSANTFDTVSYPALPGRPGNYQWDIDYGTGTSSEVTLSVNAMPWYFTGAAANDYWTTEGNWNYSGHPGASAVEGDVIVFDQSRSSRNTTNIHAMGPAYAKELRVVTDGTWRFHNNERDIVLSNPIPGDPALVTKEGSGVVTFDCDLRLDDDTVFGGSGTGTVIVNGSIMPFNATSGPRYGVSGSGGLTKDGDYTLTLNRVASYQGDTVVNGGTLLFNAESAGQNPEWVSGDPSTYYLPVQMAPVTVNAGGILGGTGILRAPVTVAGGVLSPGESAGIFSMDSLALDHDATLLIELDGDTPGNGAGFHDQAVVDAMLSIGGTLEVVLLDGYEPGQYDSYEIIKYGTLDPQGASFDECRFPDLPDGLMFFINYGTGEDSSVSLNVNIPEPASVVLLGVSAAALGWRRRKRDA